MLRVQPILLQRCWRLLPLLAGQLREISLHVYSQTSGREPKPNMRHHSGERLIGSEKIQSLFRRLEISSLDRCDRLELMRIQLSWNMQKGVASKPWLSLSMMAG